MHRSQTYGNHLKTGQESNHKCDYCYKNFLKLSVLPLAYKNNKGWEKSIVNILMILIELLSLSSVYNFKETVVGLCNAFNILSVVNEIPLFY